MSSNRLPAERLLRDHAGRSCAGVAGYCLRIVAIADLPSRFGQFQAVAFSNDVDDREHLAVVRGDVTGAESVLVRLHSECLTGDALGSLRCDCRDQLEAALRLIGQEERGVLLYLRQEGRGIGLLNKIRAYALQDRGLDTVEANLALGFREDEREYGIAAAMLAALEVRSIRLLTNNPTKIADLERHGVRIVERVPLVVPPNEYNRFYLETKARRSHHLIVLPPREDVEIEQDDVAVLEERPGNGLEPECD